ALITGNLYAEQWGIAVRPVDFFDLKADLEALLALSKKANQVKWLPAQHPALHPGQSAQLELAGQVLGYVGALHPRLVQALDLKHVPFLFELDFELCKKIVPSHYQAISKFPTVRRDLAMIVDQALPVVKLQESIQEELAKCLNSLVIFDIYEGQHIEPGKKSVALGLIFQDANRTLVDEEINSFIAQVVARLEREFKIILRT
ncbi:MAG TPA: phenylalanine--tRNA ligase subunit beta, partial [Coxiellaceae bacterium]|nr:phenylalanine--tRNA ligase subunit beta [Coxiellaceae bacterium]